MLRRQNGFTLPEMLTAISMAMIISLAAFTLIEVTMHRAGETAARVDTNQRARAAMDTITRQLRSEVCLNKTTPPIVSGTDTSVGFYADFTDQSNSDVPPVYHVLTFSGGRITENDYAGTSNHAKPPTFTYDLTKGTTRVVLSNAQVYRAPKATVDTPVFQYYAYDNANPPQTSVRLPTPLSATDRARVARIDVTFRATASTKQTPAGPKPVSTFTLPVQDQVQVREVDPNSYDPTRAVAPNPSC
jgi:prepilin-type N-terminal cleavage/methylation domain-containing protein